MTDDPKLPAETEEAVRRALAEVRVAEPMPREVAARLDARLADLVAERSAPTAPVVDLVARWRRRWSVALVAAAATVAVGVGVPAMLNSHSGGDAKTSSAADSASSERDMSAGALEAGSPSASSPEQQDDQSMVEAPAPALKSAAGRIRPDHARRDIRRLRDLTPLAYSAGLAECPAALEESDALLADYAGDAAYVVFETVPDTEPARERAIVTSCADGAVLRTVIVPAR